MTSTRVELTSKEQKALETLRAQPLPVQYAGVCAGTCQRKLPVGYLYIVTKWDSVSLNNGTKVQTPAEIWCRDCGKDLEGEKRSRRRRLPPFEPPPPDPKQIAIKLYSVMSRTEPMGSKKLARLANLEYSDVILEILKKLRAAGKVIFIEGRWKKA